MLRSCAKAIASSPSRVALVRAVRPRASTSSVASTPTTPSTTSCPPALTESPLPEKPIKAPEPPEPLLLHLIECPESVAHVDSLMLHGRVAVVSACSDGCVYIHDARSAVLMHKSAKLGKSVHSVCVDAEAGVLFAGTSEPNAVHCVSLADGSARVVVSNMPGEVRDVLFIKSLNAIVAYLEKGIVRVYSCESGALITEIDDCASRFKGRMALSRCETMLALPMKENDTIRIVTVGGDWPTRVSVGGDEGDISALDFSADGKHLCGSAYERYREYPECSQSGAVNVWSTTTGKNLRYDSGNLITAAALLPGGQYVALGERDPDTSETLVIIVDLDQRMDRIHYIQYRAYNFSELRVSVDGSLLFVCSDNSKFAVYDISGLVGADAIRQHARLNGALVNGVELAALDVRSADKRAANKAAAELRAVSKNTEWPVGAIPALCEADALFKFGGGELAACARDFERCVGELRPLGQRPDDFALVANAGWSAEAPASASVDSLPALRQAAPTASAAADTCAGELLVSAPQRHGDALSVRRRRVMRITRRLERTRSCQRGVTITPRLRRKLHICVRRHRSRGGGRVRRRWRALPNRFMPSCRLTRKRS